MKCSFCDSEYVTGTGLTIFRKDGSAHRYCSRRCEKFTKMHRNPRKLKWTGKFEKFGGKAKTKKKAPLAPALKAEAVKPAPAPVAPISPKTQKAEKTALKSG